MTEPLPTRESLLQSLKEDLESFTYILNNLDICGKGSVEGCITDAIARINDMLNVDNASRGEQK